MYRRERILKFLQRHADLYDVVNLHLFSLKLFGELYVWRNRSTGQLYISWKSFACFAVILVCLIVLFIGGHLAQQALLGEGDATYLHQGTAVLIEITGVFAITISISNAIVGKNVWAILERLDGFDRRMIVLRAPVDHRTEKRIILGGSLMLFIGVVVFTSAFTAAITKSYRNPTLQLLTIAQVVMFVTVIISMVCQVAIVLFLANARFYHLRKFFEMNFLPWKPSSFLANEFPTVNRYGRCTDARLFRSVLEAFESLSEAMQLTNQTYYVQLFAMTTSNIPTPTLALYATYRSFMASNYDMQYLIITMAVSSWLYMLTYLVLIFLNASIKREVDRLIQSYHHFTNLYHVEFERLVKDSANHISSRNITLHLGPKELDWKLAFSTVSIVVSYLVILIQFDRSGSDVSKLTSP
uniref:Gustatory receptor n=1 Tax=Anopheles farauti TaxID=69004 RepID=A0A182QPB5_9DIPT